MRGLGSRVRQGAVLFAFVLLPIMASAQIYRWTDEQGKLHFSEQPPPTGTAQQIEVKPQVMERDSATKASEQRTARIFEVRRQEEDQARNQNVAQLQQQEKECHDLRSNLAAVSAGGRYYKKDDNGERSYYSDQELTAARQGLTSKIAERCK